MLPCLTTLNHFHYPDSPKLNFFALVIGIDTYANLTKLHGGVSDAKAMKAWLEEDLQVPRDHIRTLLDGEATRDAIIHALHDLRNDHRIENGDPVVIFFAGYGGELDAPSDWGYPAGSKIECIIPQDYKAKGVLGIPDRTVHALIEDTARIKGDNITVIFDCCYSASDVGVQRAGYVPRTVMLDPNIPGDLDQEIWGSRVGAISSGFGYEGLQLHVLLSACGKKEHAYEHEGHGLFTAALLSSLKKSLVDDLTYTQLIERLGPLDRQNPRCEGANRHRVLFDARDWPRGRVHYSLSATSNGQYIIGAGSAHGVSHGVEFTLYSNTTSALGVVVDKSAKIDNFETTISLSESLHLTETSFAKLSRVGRLPLYLPPEGSLPSVLVEALANMNHRSSSLPVFRRVEDLREGKMELVVEGKQVVLRILDQRLKSFGMNEPSFEATHQNAIRAAHYYGYLDLQKEDNIILTRGEITIDFYLLEHTGYDRYGLPVLAPVEPGLCRKDPVSVNSDVIDFVVTPDALYGMKVTNDTPYDLYLNAFIFNNSDLTIIPYYTQPSGTLEAPLKCNGTFTIGYGPGETEPFSYALGEDQDIDIGYLKIFFATQPIDLSDISQVFSSVDKPPAMHDDTHQCGSNVPDRPRNSVDGWCTILIPVVQRRM